MPPSPLHSQNSLSEHIQSVEVSRDKRSTVGPVVGIVIILILLSFGALYFWGQRLNTEETYQQIPLITSDDSTQ